MRSIIEPNLNVPRTEDKPRRIWPWAFLLLAVLLPGCASVSTSRVKDTTHTFDTVVIDAGHGGYDDGAKSRWGGREKNNNLSVVQKLRPKLAAAGFKTVMTRNSDVFIELNERARISNRQTNAIFVSVHFNDSPKRKISGTEVYYNASLSRPLAQRILGKIDAIPGCTARFVKTANYRVLRLNEYPAVLVECGYLSNRNEGSMCSGAKHHERLAQAIASAIIEQRGPLKSATVQAPVAPAPAATPAAPPVPEVPEKKKKS
jgi:N-acetylmuramoyl-L-alanine amidase